MSVQNVQNPYYQSMLEQQAQPVLILYRGNAGFCVTADFHGENYSIRLKKYSKELFTRQLCFLHQDYTINFEGFLLTADPKTLQITLKPRIQGDIYQMWNIETSYQYGCVFIKNLGLRNYAMKPQDFIPHENDLISLGPTDNISSAWSILYL
jgi:hypothetical protein